MPIKKILTDTGYMLQKAASKGKELLKKNLGR